MEQKDQSDAQSKQHKPGYIDYTVTRLICYDIVDVREFARYHLIKFIDLNAFI